jgi:hypothetical protein
MPIAVSHNEERFADWLEGYCSRNNIPFTYENREEIDHRGSTKTEKRDFTIYFHTSVVEEV